MDDWGDPWADESSKPLPKLEVTPNGTSGGSGSLPEWNDDTKWEDVNNDDADWGDFQDPWNQQEERSEVYNAAAQKLESESSAASTSPQSATWASKADILEQDQLDNVENEHTISLDENAANHTTSLATEQISKLPTKAETTISSPVLYTQEEDNIVTEDSDSTGLHESAEEQIESSIQEVEVEEADSARPSTSSSGNSISKLSPGSPRTSVEDENHGLNRIETTDAELPSNASPRHSLDYKATTANIDNLGEQRQTEGDSLQSSSPIINNKTQDQQLGTLASLPPSRAVPPLESITRPDVSSFSVDRSIVQQLLSIVPGTDEMLKPDDGPLGSTAAKKAWYRVTRKQTMREFNAGQDDDNYVRVTWRSSHVRTEVDTVVSRWMIEDRATGKATLGRPSAAFGWDQTSQPVLGQRNTVNGRSNTQPSVIGASSTKPLESSELGSKGESPTTPVAQFGWSSTPADVVAKPVLAEGSQSFVAERHHTRTPKVSFTSEISDKVRPMSTDLSSQSIQFKHKKGSKSVNTLATPASRPSIDALVHSAAQNTVTISPMVPTEKPTESVPELPAAIPTTQMRTSDSTIGTLHGSQTRLDYHEEEDVWDDSKDSSAVWTTSIDQASSQQLSEWSETPIEPPSSGSQLQTSSGSPTGQSLDVPTDPWASADFSIFDSTPPASSSLPKLPTPALTSLEQCIVPSAAPIRAQTETSFSQDVVLSIISALPKIDYMLR